MKGKILKTLVLVGVLTLVVGAGQAWAQTADFSVSARVIRSCTITATNISFGDYDPLSGADIDRDGSITVQCTKNTVANLAMVGVGPMIDGSGNSLTYGLYQDASRTVAWGINADRHNWTASSKDPETLLVYARLTAGQDVPAGDYSDTVTAEIQF